MTGPPGPPPGWGGPPGWGPPEPPAAGPPGQVDAPFPWGLAIGVAVGLGLVGAVLSPITVLLVGLSLPVAVLGVSVSAVICFRRGARSPRADAVGFGIALAPLLSVLPLVGLGLYQGLS